ncbi:MAG: GAF domain-containing protein [Limnothrix sp. RL_2_0]|nr:GAF domain-containing protein [Limnothrix sp. RL_2_0]
MFNRSLNRVNERLNRTLARNRLLQNIVTKLRRELQVNRVVAYYFYRPWKGQVIVESLSHDDFSILGSTGADDCFNDNYANLYLGGRVLRVEDIELTNFDECHLDFLRSIRVRADLVAPIIVKERLWGLLVAHHSEPRAWSDLDVERIQSQSVIFAQAPSLIQGKK